MPRLKLGNKGRNTNSHIITLRFEWFKCIHCNAVSSFYEDVLRNQTARKTKTKRIFPIGRRKVHQEVYHSCGSSVFIIKKHRRSND